MLSPDLGSPPTKTLCGLSTNTRKACWRRSNVRAGSPSLTSYQRLLRARSSASSCARRLRRPECLDDLLRLDRGRVELDTEGRERVADGIGDGRRRRDRAAFADPLHAERVERRGRML